MLILTPHTSDRCPVAPDSPVAYRLVNETTIRFDRAGSLAWGLRDEPGRIEAFAVVEVARA